MKDINKINEINNKTNTELLIDYLEQVITDEMVLNSFIRDLKIYDISNNEVAIELKTNAALEIIKQNYLNYFNDGVKNVVGKKYEVKLQVKGEHFLPSNKNGVSVGISKKYNFNNYVEGKFNKEPIEMVKRAIKQPGIFSPIFITSESGFGKTHLLHAVGNVYKEKGVNVRYIEPNKFTKNVYNYSKQGGETLTNYIAELNDYGVLLFDDIQNLGDREITLKVLFQILNEFIINEKQIIITADKHPNELSGFEARFITRFTSGLTTNIQKPNLEDLIDVIKFKLKDANLSPNKWEDEAIAFIARNNSSSIRAIEGAIKRVQYYLGDGNEQNLKYTYIVIQNIFKELIIDPAELTPVRIINTVATYYGIKKSDLLNKSRKANIMMARHMAMWLVRKILKLPLKEIGNLFGGRDHSTVISAIKNIDRKMSINQMVKIAANRIETKIKAVT